MYKKVLVSLDGSKSAEVVLAYARELAGRLNFELDFLHVCPLEDSELQPMCQAYIDHIAETLKKQSESIRSSLGAKADGPDVKSKMVIGFPPDEILKYANENKVDIIMLATRGRSRGGRSGGPNIGSVTDKVIHASRVSVWLVPSEIRRKSFMIPHLKGVFLSPWMAPNCRNLSLNR